MSTPLKLSATLSTLAMAALVVVVGIGQPDGGGAHAATAATARGSLLSVLLRA